MKNTNSAGIIIYRRTKVGIKFLLLYHGGRYWNFPKGKLDDGEKSFNAAIREVFEETGLKRKELIFVDWFKVQDKFVFTKNGEKISRVVSYYLAETKNKDIKISIEEHHGYGWFVYNDAYRILYVPNLKRNLKRAYEIIKKRDIYRDQKTKNVHSERFGEKS